MNFIQRLFDQYHERQLRKLDKICKHKWVEIRCKSYQLYDVLGEVGEEYLYTLQCEHCGEITSRRVSTQEPKRR